MPGAPPPWPKQRTPSSDVASKNPYAYFGPRLVSAMPVVKSAVCSGVEQLIGLERAFAKASRSPTVE